MTGAVPERLDLPGAQVLVWPDFLPQSKADSCFERLLLEIPWQQGRLMLFGRQVAEPRLISWHGDPGASYRYSGRTNEPEPWSPTLADLRDRVERRTGKAFNGVLCNRYRDGRDHMGWHTDDEPEVGPVIASVSLGAPRRFQFRPRGGGPITATVDLPNGSLLVMTGETQVHYQHRIAKTARQVGERINLTFRQIRIQNDAADTVIP